MTLCGHSKEVLYVTFDKDMCASISKDLTLIVQQMDFDHFKGIIRFQNQDDSIAEDSTVAILKVEAFGKEPEKIFVALSSGNQLKITCLVRVKGSHAAELDTYTVNPDLSV